MCGTGQAALNLGEEGRQSRGTNSQNSQATKKQSLKSLFRKGLTWHQTKKRGPSPKTRRICSQTRGSEGSGGGHSEVRRVLKAMAFPEGRASVPLVAASVVTRERPALWGTKKSH